MASYESLGELCKKLFVMNKDVVDAGISLKECDFNYIPVLVAFLALVIINIRVWDRFRLPENIVQPPFDAVVPCIEAAGHWVLSNILMTFVLYIHRIIYNSLTPSEHKTKSWHENISNYLRGIRHDKTMPIEQFPYIPFLITLCISFVFLIASLSVNKKRYTMKNF
ncbi:uncharacterized protein LOC106662484 [Cimex lectularius]|uniref:Uncharacterized protein n=1 Tax=Cimex lectularius TaxID=79782 RepID=A0A8I6TDT3_CIMLE|nr:uncharacterized protein LOC106662484 [Cimex lectularius]